MDQPASQTGRISRRTFLERSAALGIGSSAALALLESCSVPGSPGTTLTYWNLFGGGDGVRMVQMQDAYSHSHPNVDLKAVTLAWGAPYYTKLAMAASGGRPPDVAISHITRVPNYARANMLDAFDLDELAKVGITEDKFLPAIWKNALFNGKLYAIPLDTHPFVAFYNVDICQKAGLLNADGSLKPIEGPDALITALKQAQQAAGAGTYGTAFEIQGVTPWRLFYSLYSQLGGSVLSPDAKELTLDNAKAEQALSFMRELTVTNKVAPPNIDYAGSVALFGSNKSAFLWNGEWEVTTFVNQKMNFNMAPFPHVFGQYHTQADSHSFILPRQSAIDPVRRAASLEFISFMLKDSFTWAQGGHIPAYLPVATSDDYKKLKPQSNYASVAPDIVIDPIAWFSGSGSELENQAGAAFGTVLNGQATPQQGIKQFSDAIRYLLSIPIPL